MKKPLSLTATGKGRMFVPKEMSYNGKRGPRVVTLREEKKINVNLGCGTNIVEGWVNIDVVRPANADDKFVLGDALNIPLKDGTVDYILLDQVLEHIALADIVPALYEIRRVLKKGGRCVIMVPDFEGAVKQWLEANLNESWDPMRYRWFSEVVYGNQEHEGEFHKTAMSPRFLHEVLRTVGLTKNTITFWPAFGVIPDFPGMRPNGPEARCRNAQLVADIIKI